MTCCSPHLKASRLIQGHKNNFHFYPENTGNYLSPDLEYLSEKTGNTVSCLNCGTKTRWFCCVALALRLYLRKQHGAFCGQGSNNKKRSKYYTLRNLQKCCKSALYHNVRDNSIHSYTFLLFILHVYTVPIHIAIIIHTYFLCLVKANPSPFTLLTSRSWAGLLQETQRRLVIVNR